MEEKKVSSIICEMLVGMVMTLPLVINAKYKYLDIAWILVIFRLLFSIGIPLTVVKLMSIIYRMFSFIFKRALYLHPFLYYLVFGVFVVGGIYEWDQYQQYMQMGYFWLEVLAYIISSVWFLIDVNSTKCIRRIKSIYKRLIQDLQIHEDYVEKYKTMMDIISQRKNRVLKELEQFYPKKFLSDPLKNLRKEVDISRADNYQRYIPHVNKEDYTGVSGLIKGSTIISLYDVNVNEFVKNMQDDRNWMEQEMKVYAGEIDKLEKQLKLIKVSGSIAEIEESEILAVDDENRKKNQLIYKKELEMTKESSKNVKDFWKMNKEINKLRRNHYAR